MQFLQILSLLILPFAVAERTDCGRVKIKTSMSYIKGTGSSYIYHGQWPWHVPLFYSGQFACGSTLITRWHILTAAHCVIDPSDPKDYEHYHALFGRYDLKNSSETDWINRTFSAVYPHEDYDDDMTIFKSNCDIAVFRMSEQVDFTDFIRPVCMPKARTTVAGVDGYVVGHGFGEMGSIEDVAKQAKLRTISAVDCIFEHRDHNKGVSLNSFCASTPLAATCRGDSGGGFFVAHNRSQRYSIYGVLSQGLNYGECQPNDYTVFVSVPKFIAWIHETIALCDEGQECVSPCELNPCHRHAICEPLDEGEFKCTCKPGSEGDGMTSCKVKASVEIPRIHHAKALDPCSPSPCGLNARCDPNANGAPICTCLQGFIGLPPNCRQLECFIDDQCPGDRGCIEQRCTDLCLAQRCLSSSECRMVNHKPTCQCTVGFRKDEHGQCTRNTNVINGIVSSFRCCEWVADDWPIVREFQTFIAANDTRMLTDDFEVSQTHASEGTERLNIINPCLVDSQYCQYRENIKFLPVKVARVFPNLLAYFVHGYAVERVKREHLDSLEKILWLSMESNAITTLDDDALDDLVDLRFLALDRNKLQTLSPLIFKNNLKLERLSLLGNQLASITAQHLVHLTRLNRISFCDNKLRSLEPDLFATLSNLTSVYLCDNQISFVPNGLFDTLPLLETVNLQGNWMTSLSIDAFNNNSKLKTVKLGNRINRLGSRLFDNKPQLSDVAVNQNSCVLANSTQNAGEENATFGECLENLLSNFQVPVFRGPGR